MESGEPQAAAEPPEQLIPADPDTIQESEADRRLQVLFEACKSNDHLRAFLEAYKHDENLWDLLRAVHSNDAVRALVKAYRDNKDIRTIVHHQPASEPIDDYITEFETRCQLFARFQECTNACNFLAWEFTLNATVFAIVMVAPIGILQRALSDQQHRDAWLINYFGMTENRAADVVKRYRPGWHVTTKWILDGAFRRPMIVRSQNGNSVEWKKCQLRDDSSCVFTGTCDPAESYIFPCNRNSRDFHHLLSLLLTFWGESSGMRSYLMEFDDTYFPKRVENMLCLNRQLQHWWYDGRFALKPLRKEGDKIIVQWYWLKDSFLRPMQPIRMIDDMSSLVDPHGWGDDIEESFAQHKSGRKIETGHIFAIGGGNPEHLPAFELLELQWYLVRVAAISGAHGPWTKGV
ncbi:hypothetical protein ACSS6W_007183 [Trichoderma asperelloides]